MSATETALITKIIDAHGGKALWDGLSWIEAEISAWGFLFRAKQTPPLDHVLVQASTVEPRFFFLDYPEPGRRGELIGDSEVRILDRNGRVIESRMDPRSAFRGMRRKLRWDPLDFLYFGGYATWNYLVTPFLFMRRGFSFQHLGTRRTPQGNYSCLGVTFPEDLPTHCRTQTYYFDESNLLRRLDYTAEVVGSWAHAAHFCEEYKDFSGLKIPTRRRVRPRLLNRPLSGPTLVAIDIHNVILQKEAA